MIENIKNYLKDLDFQRLKDFFEEFIQNFLALNSAITAIVILIIIVCMINTLNTCVKERSASSKKWQKANHPMELAGQNNSFRLLAEEILIGRHSSSDIRIPDMRVSRYHAVITVAEGVWTIADLGSTSGTFVNGSKITAEYTLSDGDEIMFGDKSFVFRRIPPPQPKQPKRPPKKSKTKKAVKK